MLQACTVTVRGLKSPTMVIEIELKIEGNEVWVSAHGSAGQRPTPHSLGGAFTVEALETFAKKVGGALRKGAALDDSVVQEAQRLHDALFQGEVRDVVTRATEAGQGMPLLRLMIRHRALQKIPWEALCRPGKSAEFLATGSRLLVARGVSAPEACEPRQVDGAVRLLAIAPMGDVGLSVLRDALTDSIDSGAIDWLPPITGERATERQLFKAIREGSPPDVIHFRGHGGVDENGQPALRLADDEYGEAVWLRADALAQELGACFSDGLRLVVLEACEGALPGAFGSAAELIAQAGARVVVAHLWPMKSEAARTCSEAFYRALTASRRGRGNVAASVCAARRTLLAKSAEGFAPVVYLRGDDPVLFHFAEHDAGAPSMARPVAAIVGGAAAQERRRFVVPFLKDSRFLGRDTDLAELHSLLKAGGAIGVGALTGMGGIGKTQLAVEYAYRYKSEYPGGVYWVNAAKSWQDELATLAEKVGVREDNAPESERRRRLARAFVDYLAENPGALVIFDNVDDPLELQNGSLDVVPTQLPCRLLFTSRRQVDAFPMLNVRVLAENDAVTLLLGTPRRRGLLDGGPPEELAAARSICRALGCLPLAIALASAYLDKRPRITLTGYLSGLVKRGAILVAEESKVDPRELPTLHERGLRAKLAEQCSALRAGGDALQVLQTAALVGEAEQVPRARLSLLTGLSDEPEEWREAPLDEALRELSGLSLIEKLTEDAVQLHPLVREFAELQIEDRTAFAAERAQRLGDALWDMRRLHKEVARRGIDPVLEDLGIASKLAGTQGQERLAALLRPLDRESHCVRRWDPEAEPGFFLQQLRNRCFEMGREELRKRAEETLDARGWPWLCEKIETSRESEALVRTLQGHTDWVFGVAVTADGRFAVSASRDTTLNLWDLSTGQTVRTLHGHSGVVLGVTVTSDGRFGISASEDCTLRVWDLASGISVRTLEGHKHWVMAVAVTTDRRLAVSASRDATLKVWRLSTGQLVRTLEGHTNGVTVVAVTADGRYALSGSDDATLILWDIDSGQAIRTLQGHTGSVSAVAVTLDGRFAVSASTDFTLKVWELATGRLIYTIDEQTDCANALAVTGDGRFIVSASTDATLKIWELTAGRLSRTLYGHTQWTNGVAITADGRFAVSASCDTTLKVWDLALDVPTQRPRKLRGGVIGVAMTADGQTAVSASADSTLRVWNVATGRPLHTLQEQSARVNGVAISADGRFVIAASADSTLQVWELATGVHVSTLRGHSDGVNSVAVTADGQFAVSASADRTIKVWDLAAGRSVHTLHGHTDGVRGVAVTKDGRLAISASSDRTLKVWDLGTGQALRTLHGHEKSVNCVVTTADGRSAVSASSDRTLKVWDIATGHSIHSLQGHTGRTFGLAVTLDGRFAVSVSMDKTLNVWDLHSCHRIAHVEIYAPLLCCAVTPTGGTILAGDLAEGLHILEWWNAPNRSS